MPWWAINYIAYSPSSEEPGDPARSEAASCMCNLDNLPVMEVVHA
jgi:hypothetical protein